MEPALPPNRISPLKVVALLLVPTAILYWLWVDESRPPAGGSPGTLVGWNGERERMVREQLMARGIRDERVLKAMRKVPRHEFVPDGIRKHAYRDSALPIGEDQTISQPYIVAAMTEALKLRGTEKVLEIGTGSGYQAAVLAEIVPQVFTIEIVEPLGRRAEKDLGRLGYKNIHIRVGDGYAGWPEEAPFDAIIITCAPDHTPPALVEQLKPGGRMILPRGRFSFVQDLVLIVKGEDEVCVETILANVRFVPMTGEAEKK